MWRRHIPRWLLTLVQRRSALLLAALVLVAGIVSPLVVVRAMPGLTPPGNRTTLPGHLIPALQHATPVQATDGNRTLQLTITLKPRNSGALASLIQQQSDKHSKLYHHYLTPQQYSQGYAPTQATVNAVEAYLRSQGIAVHDVSANHLLIHASASVATVNAAFQIQISDYVLAGRHVYAPSANPSVPSAIAGDIVSIGGLANVATVHRLGSAAGSTGSTGTQKAVKPFAGTGVAGLYTPTDLRTAYDVTPLINNADDGTGQTVAIVEFDEYDPTMVNTYLSYFGLPQNYQPEYVDTSSYNPGPGEFEVEMDMEIVSALAPNANQLIYVGPPGASVTETQVEDLYNQIVQDDAAHVISTSWGSCEADSGTAILSALDTIFQSGAAQGQAFFAASGDSGAYDCYRDTGSPNQNSYGVDSPADDPYVTGVGGTSLHTGTGATYSSETAWSDTNSQHGCVGVYAPSPYGCASGGGLSTYFALPSYQTGNGVSGINGMREVPDVSADADPYVSGYAIISYGCDQSGNCGAYWFGGGGTSAAAPLWAGLYADLDTSAAKAISGYWYGAANPNLYALFNSTQPYKPFHDVTSGTNFHYTAQAGYDMVSGLGTPDGWNLARDLLARQVTPSPAALALTTTPGVSPSQQSITLTNQLARAVTFTAATTQSWVSVSPTSGSIAAFSSQTFTVTFAIPVTDGPKTYSDSVAFNVTLTNSASTQLSVPVTVVATPGSKQWYFAEGYTGGSFTEYLTLANPNPTAATVTVAYYLGDGSVKQKTYVVSATARQTLTVNSEIGNGQNVSMVVTSDQPIVAERPMYFTYTGLRGYAIPGGSDVLGATSLSQDFDFGYLDTSTGHDTWLTVLNQQSTAMTVAIQYFSASGSETDLQHTVAAHSRGTIHVNGEGLAPGRYSALVHLSAPGLVERPLYLVDGTTGATGAADVVGVAAPQSTWYFAEGYSSSSFSERYLVSNPTTTPATVTVTYLQQDGTTATVSAAVGAGQQHVFATASTLGTSGVNNSAVVTAVAQSDGTTPVAVLAERFISFRYGPSAIPGASDVLGATAPSQLFAFAEGYTGGSFSEWLTIENPSPTQTAIVQVTFLPQNSGSSPTVRTYPIGPNTRFTLNTATVLPGQSFSMTVESDVPVVAERPMYFRYGPLQQSGGTDVVGYQPLGG